ncbi:P-loop containing nucleoside triphosphate hydrolase protein [Zychaea mexicana]|uniref:P-loop containing nucleoside triphosphate hydrolase protein n=1 Tax=Zychaea mexicana TaxID=64656 RepID=UPI0022FDEBC0|nr:P-loop containing nucleoside triphosphate hydrolase protein [Zychaea mexicana]KAI9494615.1 P-loop containing nucleoside triphosphate hydrolase protein [Zychaea mexicana]
MIADLILTQTQYFTVQTINIATMLLAIVLHHVEHTRNSTGSGILLFYWLFTTLVNGYRLWAGGEISVQHMGLFTTTYVLSCLMFILENCKCPTKQQAFQLHKRLSPSKFKHIWKAHFFLDELVDATIVTKQLLVVLKLLHDTLQFAQPLLLYMLMDWVANHTALTQQIPEPLYKGASIAFYMFSVSVVQSLLLQQFLHRSASCSSQLRSLLVNALCRKSLSAVDTPSVNMIEAYIRGDVQTLADTCGSLYTGWSAPLQIALGLSALHYMFGFTGWAGAGIMLLAVPAKLLLAHLLHYFQNVYDINQNNRLCIMRDMLRGIRTVKLYAWERPFMIKAIGLQNNEVKALRRIGGIATVKCALFSTSYMPLIASFTTFVFASIIQHQTLTNQTLLVTIVIFDLLWKPISDISKFSQLVVRSSQSLKSIESYLSLPDVFAPADNIITTAVSQTYSNSINSSSHNYYQQQREHNDLPLIEAHYAAFDSTTLQLTDLTICKGELVGVVGSKRTALINALLGQLPKTQGELTIRGSIAYVSRDPWIFDSNLQDNIVFGQRWDPLFYRNVLDICEISEERGVYEQKARISLARALYSRADIYLFDDPFTHMHPQLGRRLFNRVIQGHLQTKTRVLITHTFSCLHQLERIIMLWNGEMVMDGTFGDLMSKQRGRLYHIMATEDNNNNSVKDTAASAVDRGSSIIDKNDHDGDKDEIDKEEHRSECWSTYAKSCSLMAVVMVLLLQSMSQLAKVGSYMWLNYGRIMSSDAFSFLGTFAAIVVSSVLVHTLQCIFLWIVCAVCSAKSFHTDLLCNIMRAPTCVFGNNAATQNTLHRLSANMKTVNQALPKLFHRYLVVIASVTSALAVIAFSTPFIILVLIPLGFCYCFLRRQYLAASLRYHNMVAASDARIDAAVREMVSGAVTIRTCNQTQRFLADGEAKVANTERAFCLVSSCDRWIAVRAEFLGSLALLSAALFAVLDVVYGAAPVIDAGLVGLSLYYAMSIPRSLESSICLHRDIELKMASVAHIKKVLPREPNDRTDTISVSSSWPDYGRVSFEKYTSASLSDATFTINPGERISVVGGNIGIDLLREHNQTTGTTTGNIDIDGIDIHTLRLHDLRSRINMITADAVLFNEATLRENLDPCGHRDDLAMWEALNLVQIDVQSLDLPVSEQRFSNEQCWLISLARALLRRTRIVVIEEPDEMDVETDELVQRILQQQFNNCTRIIIARKLDTVMESDRVLVIDQVGRVSAFDTPHAILKHKGSLLHALGSSLVWDGYTAADAVL